MPSIEYFAHWLHHGEIIIEAFEHYPKRTWRNKTSVVGPGLPLIMSVPLKKGKNNKAMIREVEISYDESWYRVHMTAIRSAYGKTAFFEEIEQDLEGILFRMHRTLWELNLDLLDFILSLIPAQLTYTFTGSYQVKVPEHVTDLRAGVAAGMSKLPLSEIPAYAQVHRLHKSFMPNLSILDLICHLGPAAAEYLDRYAKQLYR